MLIPCLLLAAALTQTAPGPAPAPAQAPAQAPTQAQAPASLAGAWTVDLSTNPAQPYLKPMHLNLAADGTLTGDFYESPIEAGRWKAQGGRLCVAFRTTDGVGPYHTAACGAGDHVEGQTWAEHRNFVFLWNATREQAAPPAP